MEYIKLDTCVQFHDHRSNNNKVMMTDDSKRAMSNRVKKDFEYPYHYGIHGEIWLPVHSPLKYELHYK